MTPRARAYLLLACVLTFFSTLAATCGGPSDIDAERASAASLRDAQQQARVERHITLALQKAGSPQ